MRAPLVGLLTFLALSAPASAEAAEAALKNTEGQAIGTVSMSEAARGGILVKVSLEGVAPGDHAFHIHETGKCEGDFKSAGGHFNPAGHEHGVLAQGGAHAGDMPNIHVPDTGRLTLEYFVRDVTLKPDAKGSLFDADGSAFVVHEGTDDYASQPSGDAGARIACGVITKS
jgi:superoxide dismutase, Cu-Zn family